MSPIIEVLIGMVFLYSLLSVLVTQINAVIATTLRLRTKHLRDAIGELIQDSELFAKVITHPLIRMVEGKMLLPDQRIDEAQVQAIITGTLNSVSNISPDTFVSVLMSLIRVGSDKELFGALLDVVDNMPAGEERRRLRLVINQIVSGGEGIAELQALIADLKDEPYRAALNNALTDIAEEIADMGLEPDSNIALMAGLRKIKNVYLRSALTTVLSASKTLDEAEQKLANWFNDGMERASDAYKRNMHRWSLIVSIIIAFFLNIDSLFIATQLWQDQTLRQTVVNVAESTDIAQLEQAVQEAQAASANQDEPQPGEVATTVNALTETVDDIVGLRLPMGWSFEGLGNADPATDPRIGNSRYVWNYIPGNYSGWFTLLLAKVVGLAATMIALAQGAPFWFGILKRLSGGASSAT